MLAGSLVVHASRVHSAAGTATPQRADIGEKVYFSDLMGWRIWYPVSGIWVGGRNVQTFKRSNVQRYNVVGRIRHLGGN
jgi:hypothetical protein